jgi:hypothetical protein
MSRRKRDVTLVTRDASLEQHIQERAPSLTGRQPGKHSRLSRRDSRRGGFFLRLLGSKLRETWRIFLRISLKSLQFSSGKDSS